jgi:hypothetical protein
MAQQKFTASISTKYSEEERVAIGIEIIDIIISRAEAGKGKDGKDFSGEAGKYSKSYLKSFNFKLAGKGKKVNLKLSGEMINSLTVLDTADGEITIGIPKDDKLNNDKAEGNILGTYGQAKPIAGKARDFMGIDAKALKEITDKYPTKKNELNPDLIALLGADKASRELADSFFDIEDL